MATSWYAKPSTETAGFTGPATHDTPVELLTSCAERFGVVVRTHIRCV